MEQCVTDIRKFQKEARDTGVAVRPQWPMIVLRTPKGWTGPRKVEGHFLEGHWRAHQIPLTNVLKDDVQLKLLEEWMRSYKPQELFKDGKLIPELRELAPEGVRRMSANPVANGGVLHKPLRMPDFKDFAYDLKKAGVDMAPSMNVFAKFLTAIVKNNMNSFRIFGPDETESNKLSDVYSVTQKVWMGEYFEEDKDGGNLAPSGRVIEMLSEHACEGWLEGYILSGRHGLINSYEPFIHIIDSMVNQHAKWLEKCKEVSWRQEVASLNILLTSTVWRQDHNGFTHQDPGFLDVVANKSPEVVRIYLPPDANCMLSTMDHCFKSQNYVNVIVHDKQNHLQYLDMEQAVAHCSKGVGAWEWASNDKGEEPDVVMASCGDVSTQEALAATALLRELLPELKIRFVNVVDLFKLMPNGYHPHGLTDAQYASLFTNNRPVIFNFHSYPWLVHRLTYKRPGQHLMHVRGYKEKGNIDTPLELAIRNETDRYSLAILAIDNLAGVLGNKGTGPREKLLDMQIQSKNYAYETGQDPDNFVNWQWKY